MQKVIERDWLSARWEGRQGLAPGCDDGSLPIPERETMAEPRCVCSSPAVMWEGEYFCVVTGDLSDRCSGAVRSLGSR